MAAFYGLGKLQCRVPCLCQRANTQRSVSSESGSPWVQTHKPQLHMVNYRMPPRIYPVEERWRWCASIHILLLTLWEKTQVGRVFRGHSLPLWISAWSHSVWPFQILKLVQHQAALIILSTCPDLPLAVPWFYRLILYGERQAKYKQGLN